jgi:putative SOS response-associated peptidase YedK
MPVILNQSAWAKWLWETTAERVDLFALLKRCPAERIRAYAIGTRVGNVRNDDATLLESIGP